MINDQEQTVGYGYDELKDFDMGYRGRKYKIITPFDKMVDHSFLK